MEQSLRDELLAVLETLPEANLRALLQVLRGMRPEGTIRYWNRAIGTIGDEDAGNMMAAVAASCERVDAAG